ncbi:MAG: hypothetical protein ABIN55_14605, partial [Aeromicrobium sp.]
LDEKPAGRGKIITGVRTGASLRAIKRTMIEPLRGGIEAARLRENQCFVDLMGGPANREALTAFAEGRAPDFTNLPVEAVQQKDAVR